MAQYLKKGSLGRMVPADGGVSDPELEEVRMSASEYKKLMQDVRNLQSQLSSERQEHEREVDNVRSDAARYKKRLLANFNKKVDEMNERIHSADVKIASAVNEAQRQTDLNYNLLRISKERANAKRGLQPKKKHSGYRFSGKIMQTKVVCGRDKKRGTLYTDVWTATLETPYDATIALELIEDRIFADLMNEDGILQRMNVSFWCISGEENRLWCGSYEDAADDENFNKKNYLFSYKFMANPKSGFWEVQITTREQVKILPEMIG